MCGILAVASSSNAVPKTLGGLKLLEYRGYDSVGVACVVDGDIFVTKAVGRVEQLMSVQGESHYCIGHTRWATHGEVCYENAHPFLSFDRKLALVHNGIIENSEQLRQQLISLSVPIVGQTDSELIVHLMALKLVESNNILLAISETVKLLKGAFALAIACRGSDKLYLVKKASPLCVAKDSDGYIACSDVATISHFAEEIDLLPDGSISVMDRHFVDVYDFDLSPAKCTHIVSPSVMATASSGCYMLDEILETPSSASRAINMYDGIKLSRQQLQSIHRIYFVGCGTAYHSGVVASRLLAKWVNMDIHCVIASQFTYANYPVDGNTLMFFISQSGETADTIRAVTKAKSLGAITYGIINVNSSTISQMVDYVSYIHAGQEMAVASTKAYTNSVIVLSGVVLDVALAKGAITTNKHTEVFNEITQLPKAMQQLVDNRQEVERMVERLSDVSAVFFVGRDVDYATAMEGSLKLKEVSYIHSEAYLSGELKHGTLALIDNTVAVVMIATDEAMIDKNNSTVTEITSRGGKVITVSPYQLMGDYHIDISSSYDICYPCLSVLPLQLMAYYYASSRGCDIDKPKNLAKSVTVE